MKNEIGQNFHRLPYGSIITQKVLQWEYGKKKDFCDIKIQENVKFGIFYHKGHGEGAEFTEIFKKDGISG